MGRLELLCPNCETPARPSLMQPPPEMFTCETCHETTLRKNLKQQRYESLVVAGTGPIYGGAGATNLATGSMIDAAQLTTTLTSGTFTSRVGDIYVVSVASSLNSADPTSVKSGAGANTLTKAASANSAGAIWVSIWYSNAADIGTAGAGDTMVATWGGTLPAAAVMSVSRLTRSATVSVLDKTKTASGTGPSFNSGLTTALTSINEYAAAALAVFEDLSAGAPSWTNPFGGALAVHCASIPGGDVSLYEGRAQLLSAAATRAGGTIPSGEIDWVIALATFKPA